MQLGFKTLRDPSVSHILLYAPSPHTYGNDNYLVWQFAQSLSGLHCDLTILTPDDAGMWVDPTTYSYTVHRLDPKLRDPHRIGGSRFIDAIHGARVDIPLPFDLIITMFHPARLMESTSQHREGVFGYLRSLQKQAYMQAPPHEWFKTMGIFMVDGEVEQTWVDSVIGITDRPIVLTETARQSIVSTAPAAESYLTCLPPLITSLPKQLSKEVKRAFRRQFFRGRADEDTTLIVTASRNHYMSDLPRTLAIFAAYKRCNPDSFLYVHAAADGPFVDLLPTAARLGLELNEDWAYPGMLTHTYDAPDGQLFEILSVADRYLSTSHGNTYDAMAHLAMYAGTLVIAPHHSGYIDMLGLGDTHANPDTLSMDMVRGLSYDIDGWTNYGVVDYSQRRPSGSISSAAETLAWTDSHPDEIAAIIQGAKSYTKNLASITHKKAWYASIQELLNELNTERKNPHATLQKYFGGSA